jgi:hypothetical protein
MKFERLLGALATLVLIAMLGYGIVRGPLSAVHRPHVSILAPMPATHDVAAPVSEPKDVTGEPPNALPSLPRG